ncbi:NAD(P)-binding domain-containing protein [Lacisediminimonas profundi]|uniref:NAD(P)-binding domain-containing protein n=1 Tax=Lacisediminimonas profundi TaxID=2603856 RepID=UPI00124BB961|nr:NAD(P)-binding domain-containing protein [Lacisediminimonas profundi]
MKATPPVAIVGAGPFGLSTAAHMSGEETACRVIGSAMHSWRNNMPKGMLLKSAGFASNLHEPSGSFTLAQFCREHDLPYDDLGVGIPIETFIAYGEAFQRRFVPQLEDEQLAMLSPCRDGFNLQMQNGTSFDARAVILTVGLDYFRHVPSQLSGLPAHLHSHSADHSDLGSFRGKDVAVLGSGASAIDTAVLLHESGARVSLIARKDYLNFGSVWGGPGRSWLDRIRWPLSPIGPGWYQYVFSGMPWAYRHLPDGYRVRTAKALLGPSGGWCMKERAASLSLCLGYALTAAQADGGRVCLRLRGPDGSERRLEADHVIAATGYEPDVRRLPFLGPELLDQLQLVGKMPRLSANFESSVPGLYFAGPIAASTFGPVMRFAAGARFASRTLSRHLRPAGMLQRGQNGFA